MCFRPVFSFHSSVTLTFTLLVAGALLSVVGSRPSWGQVPRVLHYQATLVDGSFPAEGVVDVEAAFYADSTGGPPVAGWTESYPQVVLSGGRLALLLGSQTPLPDALFDAPTLYLGMTVDGEGLPRLPVASTPFALRAGVAEAAVPGSIGAPALAPGAVTEPALADDAVTARALAAESVTPRAMADDAVTAPAIAPGAVTTSALADDAVTSRTLGPQAVVGDVLADGAVATDKLANGAVTAPKIATGEVVTVLNGLTDAVRLVGGTNVTITPDSAAGTITVDAEGGQSSSRRWKTDVKPLTDALALVEQLQGVRYRWTTTGTADVGFIAEEVGRVVPEVVTYAPNGVDAETVNYARLVAVLVEAVKAQQAQIEADRALLRNLQSRMEALEREAPIP
jgi:hypothetical protein